MAKAQVQQQHLFTFNASAVGVAANIRRDGSTVLTDPKQRFLTEAAACLSGIGGEHEAPSSGATFRSGLIHFDSAFSKVTGDFKPFEKAVKFTHGNWGDHKLPTLTTASSLVSGLVMVNRGPDSRKEVNIPKLGFSLSIVNNRDGKEPNFSLAPEMSEIVVDGKRAIVHFVTGRMMKGSTFCGLKEEYERNGKFFKNFGDCFYVPGTLNTPKEAPKRFPRTPTVLCTVVDRIEWPEGMSDNTTQTGRNRIRLQGFGSIILGELQISGAERSISMVRVEFGSPDGGEGEMGRGGGNGSGWPPE